MNACYNVMMIWKIIQINSSANKTPKADAIVKFENCVSLDGQLQYCR